MKIKYKIGFIICTVLFLFTLGFIVFLLSKAQRSEDFNKDIQLFQFASRKMVLNDSIYNSFILNKVYEDPYKFDKNVNGYLKVDSSLVEIYMKLYSFTTDSLFKYEFDTLTYNSDTIWALLNWVEKYHYYKINDSSESSIIYKAIDNFWMKKITACVRGISEINPDVKYDKKYFAITSLLDSKNYSIGVKYTSFEKLVDNVVKGKWWYILDRVIIETSLVLKIIFIFAFLVVVIGNFYFFKLIFKK